MKPAEFALTNPEQGPTEVSMVTRVPVGKRVSAWANKDVGNVMTTINKQYETFMAKLQ